MTLRAMSEVSRSEVPDMSSEKSDKRSGAIAINPSADNCSAKLHSQSVNPRF